MPPNEKPLSVRRYDQGRYLVRSQRPACQDSYAVDLDDPAFPFGRCCCVDFDIRIEAPIRRGEEPERMNCIHIRAVLSELDHARELCEAAGLQFSASIIPIHGRDA